jgi:GDPmannose 4,6-dehydratase
MTKVALIFGISGQDGSYLAEMLLTKGYEVHGVVRMSSLHARKNSDYRLRAIEQKITLYIGDVLDARFLRHTIHTIRPDEIYNLAAQSHVGHSFNFPNYTAQVNSAAVLEMLTIIQGAAWPIRFYQASTSEMFGEATSSPQDERTSLRPISPYGEAKTAAHHHVVRFREAYGLHASAGILFNHESPRRSPEFVTRKITLGVAEIYAKQRSSILLGNLDARRDWGYAPEYVKAMYLMVQQEKPGDYVIATGVNHSVRELCEYAFSLVGLDWRQHVTSDASLLRPSEIPDLRGNAAAAHAVLGWKPTITFHELIKIMLAADLESLGVGDRLA